MWSKIRYPVVIAVILALGVTNLMTLVDDSFHVKAHDFLESVAGRFISTSGSTINKTRNLRLANEELITSNKKMIIAAVALSAATRGLIVANDVLQVNHRKLTTDHESLSKKSVALKTSAKGMVAKVWLKVSGSVMRNVVSLPARVAPVAGAMVSLSVTALDLADACSILKDMNAMYEVIGDVTQDESKICGIRLPTVEELRKSIPRMN